MVFAVVTALALAATPVPAAPSAAGSTSVSPSAPLREVVYKLSYTRRLEVSQESYGGSVENDNGPSPVIGQAPAFGQANGDATDSGTLTIDVMQVVSDTLGLRVTERWDGSTPSATYYGNVGPDGSVNFTDGQMSECTRAILEYFGPNVMAGQPANTGISWDRAGTGQAADVTTNYSVGQISGPVANIHEVSVVKSKSVAMIDTTITTDVQYKPLMLVPVGGKIVMHGSRSGASSVTNVSLVGNFQRVSDTRDTGP